MEGCFKKDLDFVFQMTPDMEFLSDEILKNLSSSDLNEGINNVALSYDSLGFMHVDGTNNNNTGGRDNFLACSNDGTSIPVDSRDVIGEQTRLGMVSSIGSNQAITSHLPESPPDSEPPFSPLQENNHGLVLTSREIFNVLPSMNTNQLHDLHSHNVQSQYVTPPHQAQYNSHHQPQIHFAHHNSTNSHHQLMANPSAAQHTSPNNGSEVRIKNEDELLLHPSSLLHHLNYTNGDNVNNLLQQDHNVNNGNMNAPNNNHHNQHESVYGVRGTNSNIPYDNSNTMTNTSNNNSHNRNNDVYPVTSYQHSMCSNADVSTSYITSISDSTRVVQLVGTSQANSMPMSRISAPSTPISSSSRKRKLSTQIDCPDFPKSDPTLGSLNVGLQRQLSIESTNRKMSPISPLDSALLSSSASTTLSPPLPAIVATTHHNNGDNNLDSMSIGNSNSSSAENGDSNSLTQNIHFTPFQPQSWHKLCNQSLEELPVIYYHVDADKGFNFSISDEAFVCQKKNHFQITCHARLSGDAKFVKTPSGLEKIDSFHLHFYGVKLEAPTQTIRIEQSQSDRSKKPFYPVPIDLQTQIVSKITVGRLHFSETTSNNMRKKGRPNPEQRYFQLVVGLHVHTVTGDFPVISHGSERIIVRASNPGQFESDIDLCWQRGVTQDSIFHAGRVGINTDRPEESLVVHGNLKVSGHIVHPSDSRAKTEISELDTSVQLRNLQKIRIVRYRYEPEFAIHSGLRSAANNTDEIIDTGVIAQEVREVIPDAVKEAGHVVLPNGNVIENFLLVNKDRILMENIGAVKELCKVTDSLKMRVKHLESAKSFDDDTCSNRTLQIVIFLLVIVMAACLATVSTLYFLEHKQQHQAYKEMENLQRLHNERMNFKTDAIYFSPNEQYSMQAPTSPNLNVRNKIGDIFTETVFQHMQHNRNGQIGVVNKNGDIGTGTGASVAGGIGGFSGHLQTYLHAPDKHRFTTTAPLRKNKSKWPPPHAVLRAELIQMSAQHQGLTVNSADRMSFNKIMNFSNASNIPRRSPPLLPPIVPLSQPEADDPEKTKVADAITVPQDFETNSIDEDGTGGRHIKNELTGVNSSSNSVLKNPKSDASFITVDEGVNSHFIDKDTIVSTASSNNIYITEETTSLANNLQPSNLDASIYSNYKAVSPPSIKNKVDPDETQNTFSIGFLPNRNHESLDGGSNHDNFDASDLQTLSVNNDSSDNANRNLIDRESLPRSLPRQSNSQWNVKRTTQLDIFGAPAHCIEEPSQGLLISCQSLCFEDSNQLPVSRHALSNPQNDEEKRNEQHSQNSGESANVKDLDNNTDELQEVTRTFKLSQTNATNIKIGKTSHATQAISKQYSAEHHAEDGDGFEAMIERSYSEENLDIDIKRSGQIQKSTVVTPTISIEAHRPPIIDCWQIVGFIVADGFNKSLMLDDFCPNNGKTLNLTYIIPLSRFFKEKMLELRLSSSTSLRWTICDNQDNNTRNMKHSLNSARGFNGLNLLQNGRKTVTIQVDLPNRGYFVKDLSIRATEDMEKENLCDEKPHEEYSLLQYNFRILRDCD